MLTMLKVIVALFHIWVSQNTYLSEPFSLYDEAFRKEYGIVSEQTFEGYELENDYYLIEFSDGQIHEIESDDLRAGDPVTVWFLEDIPIRMVYDFR